MWMRRFWHDRSGTAAIELAFIAPAIAGIALLGLTVWQSAAQIENMRGALKSGARYYMSGGFNDTDGRTFAMSAWDKKPTDGNITVQRICKCAGVAQACNVLCADQTPPQMFINLSATGTATTGVSTFPLAETKVVRVR
jgi:Flp pilus assembly protein TadG